MKALSKNEIAKLKTAFNHHYNRSPELYVWTANSVGLIKFEVWFIDGTKKITVMTSRQRDSIMRSKYGKIVEKIGGLGYVREHPSIQEEADRIVKALNWN